MTDPRAVALEALVHIERDGSYANLALPAALSRGDLSDRDRAFATELVYGTLRMRRACDWLVDRFVAKPPDLPVRMTLASRCVPARVPRHRAARSRGRDGQHCAAVLTRVRQRGAAEGRRRRRPTSRTTRRRLSYPDWIVDRLIADLGRDDASAALEHMNRAPRVRMRDDGYIQDEASEWLADLVEAQPGMRVADVCAAPGGKATRLAATRCAGRGVRRAREPSADDGRERRGARVPPAPPRGRRAATCRFAPAGSTGCSLMLRARASACCAVDPTLDGACSPRTSLVSPHSRRELVDAAVQLVAPGGVLVYGVCTLAADETLGVDEHLRSAHPRLRTARSRRARPGAIMGEVGCCCPRTRTPTGCSCCASAVADTLAP